MVYIYNKSYLYNEYKVRGNFIKALIVKVYVFACLNSYGLLAQRKINIPNKMTAKKLIYPCNKKYRIFDFENNTVTVVPKSKFPTRDLEREIEFRSNNQASFIPGLASFSEKKYTENIIDGLPLARITENFEKLCEQAVATLEKYAEKTENIFEKNSKEYLVELKNQIEKFKNKESKNFDKRNIKIFLEFLWLNA